MQLLERIWEGAGEVFGGLLGGFERTVTRMFGSANARYLRQVQQRVQAINALEPKFQQMSDDELRAQTAKFKERLRAGETLNDILIEAFAVCREGGRRFLAMRHYDVQLMGGIVLHEGNIAEMVTGEGKTLVATLPAYLNALTGNGVHVVTVNDYLARRDMEWMGPLYLGLGLTVGAIQSNMDGAEKQHAYDCEITYGTNNEFGFDYLRDNMKSAARTDERFDRSQRQAQRGLHYAIIDEIDNILIDEARTPLIIAGPAHDDVSKYEEADKIAKQLKRDVHFEVNEKDHAVTLTDDGVRLAEKLAEVESFYTAGNEQWPHLIDNALKAYYLYKRDVNYMVTNGEVIIVDEFTGRPMPGRQWSDGLHQAVEAKEKVKVKQENQTLATITLQNFFKLYKKISGMTGTAMTEASEFWKIYKLNVVSIPTNRGMLRVTYPDVIYSTEKAKWKWIVDEIERLNKWDIIERKGQQELVGTILRENDQEVEVQPHGSKQHEIVPRDQIVRISRKGRPVLVGTVSIEKSEHLSHLLELKGIKHQVLNAKYHEREAEIIAQAGRKGAVTIATNMAGRGTDIILGGNPETMAWAQLQNQYATRLDVPKPEWDKLVKEIEERERMKIEGREVAERGGLHVIGTERHEARRIDLQLIGRCGRQGDPGSSRFYLSLEDDLMRIFAGERVKKIFEWVGMQEDEAIESGMVSKSIANAQRKVEEQHFEARKHVLDYDEVMDEQRKRIYGYRQRILETPNCRGLVEELMDLQIKRRVEECLARDYGPAAFAAFAGERLGFRFEPRYFRNTTLDEAARIAVDEAERMVEGQVLDQIEELLSEDEDPNEWKWEAMARWSNTRFGTNFRDRDLKKIGRDEIGETLIEKAREHFHKIDLSPGKAYLEADYPLKAITAWAQEKLKVEAPIEELRGVEAKEVVARLKKIYRQSYDRRVIEVSVQRAIDECSVGEGAGLRLDRDRLVQWLKLRFDIDLDVETLKNKQRPEVQALLFEKIAEFQKAAPAKAAALEQKLAEIFTGAATDKLTVGDVLTQEAEVEALYDWIKAEFDYPIPLADLKALNRSELDWRLRAAIEERYHHDMRAIERHLLLMQLDGSWKEHLLVMDHLRSSVGLRGYGQVDPKVEYKREGMKIFEDMWNSVGDAVTTAILRLEIRAEPQIQNTWSQQHARHDSPPPPMSAAGLSEAADSSDPNAPPEENGGKVATIRNFSDQPGRNDICWCEEGQRAKKKFKNCCLPRIRAGLAPQWKQKPQKK